MITAEQWVVDSPRIITSNLRKRKCSHFSSFTTLWFSTLQSEWKVWEAFIWVRFIAICLNFIVISIKEKHTTKGKAT